MDYQQRIYEINKAANDKLEALKRRYLQEKTEIETAQDNDIRNIHKECENNGGHVDSRGIFYFSCSRCGFFDP